MSNFEAMDLNRDGERYARLLERCVTKTPYHLPEYLFAEQKAEDGETKVFMYQDGEGFAMIPLVIRSLNGVKGLEDGAKSDSCDLITPHEYGGILSNVREAGIQGRLLDEIGRYCKQNGIICGFIRINPYLESQQRIFAGCGYGVELSNRQVYVNLGRSEEEIWNGYKSNVRRNVKRAVREGLSFEIADKTEENAKVFQSLYEKAMDHLQARKFLYFNSQYFSCLTALPSTRLCFVREQGGRVVAASIMLEDQCMAYYHLGCFDRDYSEQRPMNFLIHSMIISVKRRGLGILHLGGGGSSLMQFKAGYSEDRVEYYIATAEYDGDAYERECGRWLEKYPQHNGEHYYPLYRYLD